HHDTRSGHNKRLSRIVRAPFSQFRQFGQTKVKYLNVSILTQHDVLRLDVTMDYSCGMRSRESGSDLLTDIEYLSDPQRRMRGSLPDRFTDNVLHGNKISTVHLADFIYGDDIWMVQSRCRTSLLLETAQAFPVSGEIRRKKLQRDSAAET